MIGFMNKCPHCGHKSSFTPEEMECDKALVLWCNICGNFLNQTLTLETVRRWWLRVDEGEETIEPPISKSQWLELTNFEELLNTERHNYLLPNLEIHIKDFSDYNFTEIERGDDGTRGDN